MRTHSERLRCRTLLNDVQLGKQVALELHPAVPKLAAALDAEVEKSNPVIQLVRHVPLVVLVGYEVG